MRPDYRDTLLLAIKNEIAFRLAPSQKVGVYNGHALSTDELGTAQIYFEQSFRPEFLEIQSLGQNVTPVFTEKNEWAHSVVFSSRVRKNNETNFYRAWDATKLGGFVIVAGSKTNGIGSLRKWVTKHIRITDSYSKYHAMCFWCQKTGNSFFEQDAVPNFVPSIFSAASADKGSQILASCFDKRIKGKVADFGSGWGYLSDQALMASDRIQSIDLYEAEWHAVQQSKALLKARTGSLFQYHWVDIAKEFKKKPFEWIIMNPPFHHGLQGNRSAQPEIGKNFIQIGASSLIQGGKLLMVANQNLPYEKVLNQTFRKVFLLKNENGFKVFEATK